MKSLGRVAADDKFERLSWGTQGIATGQYPCGLVAGGMADGSVGVWNVDAIMRGDTAAAQLWRDPRQHAGAVKGCQFNPFSSHLLATGAARAELAIWDLTNPSAPAVFKPEARSKQQDDISCLAWNTSFQHILATTASDGVTTSIGRAVFS